MLLKAVRVSQFSLAKGTCISLVLVLGLQMLVQGSDAIEHLVTLVTVKCIALGCLVACVAFVHVLENRIQRIKME